jgi:(2Fe-2S) ferredoxin
MEDLANAREEALRRQRASAQTKPYHISVGMASCGIAAGAADTLEAIKHWIATEKLPEVSPEQIQVSKIGCIGLCALEPIVRVEITGLPLVTYGKVTPAVAHRILRDHIGKGLIIQEHVVENV